MPRLSRGSRSFPHGHLASASDPTGELQALGSPQANHGSI